MIESPNKRWRLEVHANTEQTESGPLTYSHTDYRLVVTDAAGAVVLEHKDMHAWDDSANRGNYGLLNWFLEDDALVLEHVGKKITRLALPPQ